MQAGFEKHVWAGRALSKACSAAHKALGARDWWEALGLSCGARLWAAQHELASPNAANEIQWGLGEGGWTGKKGLEKAAWAGDSIRRAGHSAIKHRGELWK